MDEIHGKDILYTFRRCPYAMRARWAIAKSSCKVIWREVDLKAKPKELLSVSDKSTVPLLLTAGGDVIDESLDIIKWALKIGKQESLLEFDDSLIASINQQIITQNDMQFKIHLDRYKYANRYVGTNPEYHKAMALNILRFWNELIAKNSENNVIGWLIDTQERLADLAVWPFVRQFKLVNPCSFENNKELTYLKLWLDRYLSDPFFKVIMSKCKPWVPGNEEIFFPTQIN